MKEYKTNLMDTTWNYRRILLLILLLAFDLIMSFTIAQNRVLPVWLDTTGVLAASCVGGPGFGIVLAILEMVLRILIGQSVTITIVQGIAVIAIAVAFGAYVRLGFFSNIRGVIIGVLIISFINMCIRTPEYFALFGSFSSMSAAGTALIDILTSMKLPLPFVSAISFFIIDLIDKAIILFALYGLIGHFPKSAAKLFDIEDSLPQCVIVKDTAEEEFQTEKDQLMEKAQKKLDKKKADETAVLSKTTEQERKEGK